MSKPKRTLLVTAFAVAAFCILLQESGQNSPAAAGAAETVAASTLPAHENPTPDSLWKLLLERKQVLDRIAENIRMSMSAGRVDVSEYAQARTAALLAGLDLCQTQSERIEIRGEILQWHVKAEAWAQQRMASGRATEVDFERVRVARLNAEIDLVKAQLKER